MKLLFGIKALDVAGGGAERVLATVTSGLAGRGHDVSVLSFDAPGGRSFYTLDPAVRRICLGLGPTDSPSGLKYFLRRLPALRRQLEADQPDAAIGFMHSMFVPMSFVASSLGIPVIASEHTVPEYYRGRRMEFALCAAGCLLSGRVTVLSETVRALYPGILQKRMTSVPNPVTTGSVVADPSAAGLSRKTILSVGRLDEDKDHATLIDAFAGIAGKYPDWDLKIVGEGRLRKRLEEQITREHLGNRVFLPGTTPDIESEYAAAQLFAVPSRVESLGLATAEALAAGLPVIGFDDCPGTRDLIRHGHNGWLGSGASGRVRRKSLIDGLTVLLSDDDLRTTLGGNGPDSVTRYAPDLVLDEWENLLRKTEQC